MGKLNPVKKAIRLAGSEDKLAALIGYTQPAINKAKRKRLCSPSMAVAIDKALAPAVTKSELRPDLWPPASPQQQMVGAE